MFKPKYEPLHPRQPPTPVLGAVGGNQGRRGRRRPPFRRARALRLFAVACLAFIAWTQWKQLSAPKLTISRPGLSIERLNANLATCSKLARKPQDPTGPGRERNARYIDGHRPTLIRNATVWVGEPAEGTKPEDARLGKGYSWITADVFVQFGLIQSVEAEISLSSLPKDTLTWNAEGRQLTAGIIDMHSHAGVGPLPELRGSEDVNEMSDNITPYVRSIDGVDPLDKQIQVIKSGGVTTSLVFPGSANNIGGEAYVLKHAVGKKDGRSEISVEDMLADPERNWRYMKMACGENPKRVYGAIGRGPYNRMGESWAFRHAFEQASNLNREQDDWCSTAQNVGVYNMATYLPEDLKWESLGAALRGHVRINTHCYTIPDLEAFVDHTNEFQFSVRAFHHAHETYLVPEILKRAWGDESPASALFADNMFYKVEASRGSEYAGKILWENGLDPIYVSDNPVLNAQHVVFEAAKAYRYGLPYHVALAGVTSTPAKYLGLGQRIGKIKPGFDADIVVWDSDPLSVGATPVQVWIDGTAQFENPVELAKPNSGPIVPDENLGQSPPEADQVEDLVFKGVSKVLLTDFHGETENSDGAVNVVVRKGEVSCIGSCVGEVASAQQSGGKVIELANGYLVNSFTAFGSSIGLSAIDSETNTRNGGGKVFSRAIDGLALDTDKLHTAHRYGVTNAITAPAFWSSGGHFGTSVGFRTGASNSMDPDAVWESDASLHYTLTIDARGDDKPSMSSVIGAFRKSLLSAIPLDVSTVDADSEQAFLKKVILGDLPLAVTVQSADAISAILRVKSEVEAAIKDTGSPAKIRLVIIGGAEAHLVAEHLAAANVGVVLSPAFSYGASWDERRALTGAPLTNGTAIDVLVDAGVKTALGLEEDWLIRDLALLAGIAYKNGGGRLTEQKAIDLVSSNVYSLLGLPSEKATKGHFVVYEGSPLEIGSRIRAVGSSFGYATVF